MDCFCYCKNWPFIHGSAFDTIISWVNRVKLCHIEALIDAAGDRVNFGNQLILDVLQIITVIWSDEIDGKTKVTKAPWKKDARLQYVMLVVVSRSGHNRDHCKHSLFRFWEFIWKKKKNANPHLIYQCGAGRYLHFWGSQNWWQHLLPGCRFPEWIGLQRKEYFNQLSDHFIIQFCTILKDRTLITYLYTPGFYTSHFWSHGTHGSCIPASSLHECRSKNSPVG